jgi:hypothetical protein
MREPRLEILGVYRPRISKKTWKEQWRVTGDDVQTNSHFAALVLIEALVEDLDGVFEMGKLGQMDPNFPDDTRHMQVGYDEGLLSIDGQTLILREMNCVHGTGTLRFAVYLHFYDPNRPLLWQAGNVNCPQIQDVSIRLARLMPYRTCS